MITIGRHLLYDQDRASVAQRFPLAAVKFTDVHCHCLPHLDDGPESMEEALALCRRLVQDNVSTVVATPHQLGCFENYTHAPAIRQTTRHLNEALQARAIDLTVLPGAEVRLDERIDCLLTRDEVLTLADGGRYLLLELPWDTLIDIEPLLAPFAARGVTILLAHPERNIPLLRHPLLLRRWLACGVGLQITAASLLGAWGRFIKRAAWQLLAQECGICVASDAHRDGSQPPRLMEAFNAINARLGRDLAYLLCVENPARVIRGEKLASVLAPSPQGGT
jgi:protein-tyrosine phosphatase